MSCQHLAELPVNAIPVPATVDGCPACLIDGHRDWVHLRMCLTCGTIACCDSSPRRHASKHHEDTGHPVIRSIEEGELWRWCYVDETIG
jgi:uncharacterized UBP type Zn finger protein